MRGLGRRSGGACKHYFRYLIPVYQLQYTTTLHPMIGKWDHHFNTCVNHLALCAQSKHVKHKKPSYTTPFDPWTFDILTCKIVLQEVDGVVHQLLLY